MSVLEDVAARLAEQIPSRTVYAGAVPNGSLPPRYLIVWGSEGSEESTRMAGTTNVQTPAVWITSVSRSESPDAASREAAWGAARVRTALRDWRPYGRHPMRAEASQPPRRDESIAETTFFAVEQFSIRTSV